MQHIYKTKGTCSREIMVDLDDNGIINEVHFKGGCPGNLLGISQLVKGKNAKEVADSVKGTHCGMKSTSCPDQLALAIEAIMAGRI